MVASPILNRDRKQIIDLAARHRLPAIYQWSDQADEGGLMSYGSSIAALSRRAAVHVDRILKGALPAELPIEQPSNYELVINPEDGAGPLGPRCPPRSSCAPTAFSTEAAATRRFPPRSARACISMA